MIKEINSEAYFEQDYSSWEKVNSFLEPFDEKIYAIAIIAFGSLTSLLLLKSYYFKEKKETHEIVKITKEKEIKKTDSIERIKEESLNEETLNRKEESTLSMFDKKDLLNIDGIKFEGEFDIEEGLLNGYGKITFLVTKKEEEVVFEGNFKDNKLNGYGKISDAAGLIAEGEFQNNFLHGKGKIIFTKNGITWEGAFERGYLHGEGVIYDKNEVFAKGIFENNFLNGFGEKNENGTIKKGIFLNDVLQEGEIKPSGLIMKGNFKNEKLDGIGQLIYPDKIINGYFKEGVLQEKISEKERNPQEDKEI